MNINEGRLGDIIYATEFRDALHWNIICKFSWCYFILFYYVVDHNDKQHKKYELDQFLNVLIQFILYLWLMKIIAQFSMVFQDPMSVLAHPANSMHFLFASIILLVHLWFKYRNNSSATI